MEQLSPTTKNKDRSTGWKIVLAVLLTLELIAVMVLSTRLVNFTTLRHNFIALLGGSASQRVMASLDEPVDGQNVVRDDVQIWTTDTDVEIFKMKYDNQGDLVYTVESDNDDKVLAPGTENAYTFTVGNPTTEKVDYTLNIGAWLEGADRMPIPLEFRVYDDMGRFYVGSETSWEELGALNNVNFWESLQGGATRSFTIAWQWPFEYGTSDDLAEADAYDTDLGNRALTEDIVQHVTISTYAEVYQVGEAERAWWGGAAWALVNLICMILTDALAVVEVVKYILRKKRQPAEATAYAAEGEAPTRKKGQGWKLAQIAPFAFGTVLFHVTENMRLPMVYVDKWTILMVVILLVSITLAMLTRQKEPKQEPEA